MTIFIPRSPIYSTNKDCAPVDRLDLDVAVPASHPSALAISSTNTASTLAMIGFGNGVC